MSKYVSPLRYPGGKLKVVDYVKQLMEVNDLKGGTYRGDGGQALK